MPFYIYVEGRTDLGGCFATYWYAGDDLAEGISVAEEHAALGESIANPRVESVAYDQGEAPPDTAQETHTAALHIFPEHQCWEGREGDPDFSAPAGIVPAAEEGPFDLDEIQEAFSVTTDAEGSVLQAVVDRRNLLPLFRAAFKALPSADGLEIRILGHWNDGDKTEVWLADEKLAGEAVWQFLMGNRDDLINNGYVEIVVFSHAGEVSLVLTEHKYIEVHLPAPFPRTGFEEVFASHGLTRSPLLRAIAFDCYHYHYAPRGAADRQALCRSLRRQGFELVDSWDEGEEN